MKVLIVGAGVAGLGIGWRLVQAGVEVTILERAEAASGATFAAAGMIAATAEMAGAPAPEIALAGQAHRLWPGFAAELEQTSAIPVGYRRNGALLVEAARPADLPPGTVWLDAAAARARAPMLGPARGAVWAPDEALADNRALGRALTVAFVRAGGELRTQCEVTALAPGEAVTRDGRHKADLVILAAGAWSGLLAKRVPVTPVKGEMLMLAAPPGAAVPEPVIWGQGVYLVPRGAHLLVGATVEESGFDTGATPAARDKLRAGAEALMPSLRDWALADQWAGLRPRSPDGLPLLGPLEEGLLVAAGQYRNGILFAPAIADHMRDLVLGRTEVIPAFDPRRFAK
jgi:glycine oxidase